MGLVQTKPTTYLDSEQDTKIYILVFRCFWSVFGQSWAQEPAQRPRLEKRCINQRKLAREIDSKAVWAPIKIYIVYDVGGSKIPSKAPPRGPESTPRAQKRSPRAIPNDSRVDQNSTKNIKMSKRSSFSNLATMWGHPPLLPTRAKRSKSGSFGDDPTSTCLKTVKICKQS